MNAVALLSKVFRKPYRTVGPQEAATLIDAGGLLLDVREAPEWRAGHASKARHIPLGELAGRLGEVPTDRPVLTICRSGARSRHAAAFVARNGRQVLNVGGGMQAWAAAGYALQAKGRPGRLI